MDFPMERDFWRCQPESEPWWGPDSRFALVDPVNQMPAFTIPYAGSGAAGAVLHNGRRSASFRFFPLDHNDALMGLLVQRKIPVRGRKWCEGLLRSRGRTRLVFVELKAKNRMRFRQPVDQIRSVLSFLEKHAPSILQKARWKRAVISNRKHPFAYTANDRNVRHLETIRMFRKEFQSRWNVRLETGAAIEL